MPVLLKIMWSGAGSTIVELEGGSAVLGCSRAAHRVVANNTHGGQDFSVSAFNVPAGNVVAFKAGAFEPACAEKVVRFDATKGRFLGDSITGRNHGRHPCHG